jgi:DNA polymerase III subunit epsilon
VKLFFDTETTGKADMRGNPLALGQPRVVQLAALLTDDDGDELNSLNVIIEPRGFTIPHEAAAIHGITTEKALACGVLIGSALGVIDGMARRARSVIAHNIDFDLFMLDIEFLRSGVTNPLRLVQPFCTMREMTPVCRLQKSPYPGDYKWPRLQEAHKHAFGCEFEDAHDAMADVRACAKLFFWLQSRKKEVAA